MAITAGRVRQLLHYDEKTGKFTWRIHRGGKAKAGAIAGSLCKGHRYVTVDWRTYAAHRLAWFYVHGTWPKHEIDHVNGERDDNRISNLRDVPRSVNAENFRKARRDNRSSGLLGVTRHSRGRWLAQITVRGRNHNLGLHDTAELAHRAYVLAKRRLHAGCTL